MNGLVRFVDVEGQAWVVNGQTAVQLDDDLERWIAEGREFAERKLSPYQRGTLDRTDARAMPDFGMWVAGIVDPD